VVCRLFPACLVAALPARLGAAAEAVLQAGSPVQVTSALARAVPGSVVVLADGVWADADLLVLAEGTAEKPITVRAATPGRVVLTGRSRLRLAGRFLQVEGLVFRDGGQPDKDVIEFRRDSKSLAEDCRLTQCAIVDYHQGTEGRTNRWVSLYGRRNRVDHCWFEGKSNAGATLVVWVGDQPNDHRIDANLFGPRAPLGQNGGETIRVGTSEVSMHESRTVVERNLFEACNGEIEVISSKSCGNTYRHNTFRRCAGTLTLRHGNRCVVEGNWFLGEGAKNTGGVRIIGEDHRILNNYFADLTGTRSRAAISFMQGIPESPLSGYFQVKRALVAFNTVVNCRSAMEIGVAGDGTRLPPVECVLASNIVCGTQGPLVCVTSAPTGWAWLGNVAWGAEPGVVEIAGVRVVDPRLAQGPDGVWRPAADSPVRGAAAASAADLVTEDIDGQPRPHDATDTGCDQASEAQVRFGPLRPADVGPAWRRVPR